MQAHVLAWPSEQGPWVCCPISHLPRLRHPLQEVPAEVPEPALGINFARDGMQKKDWLGLVAVHSDAWLMALAFYNGARMDSEERCAE